MFTPGKRLGRYVIQEALESATGTNEVYRALDRSRGRTVAVKVLRPELSANSKFRSRLKRETKTLSSFLHPNICSFYDVGYQDGVEFLVTEFVEGETLSERLKKGPLPQEQAIHIASEIIDALDGAHRHGIIHRDLKPGNIMLTNAGTKVMDFGMIQVPESAGSTLTSPGSVVEKVEHMSPEQIEGRALDERSDIFAFGTVLYEMLAGKPAFERPNPTSITNAVLKREPPPLRTTPHLDWIIKKALAKDPAQRFQTASELKLALNRNQALETAGEHGTARSEPPSDAEVSSPDQHANFWISEREQDSRVPLTKNTWYKGNFRIGSLVPANLIPEEQAKIPSFDIPPDGLQTSWVVMGSNLQFESIKGKPAVKHSSDAAQDNWSLRFSLLIPRAGDSNTIQFRLRPLALDASFAAYVYVRNELYREFHVRLSVKKATSVSKRRPGPPTVTTEDVLITSPNHLSLGTTHEWTTPPGELTITVSGKNNAAVRGGWDSNEIEDDFFMNTEHSYISGSIINVRKAADDFRAEYSDKLDDIETADLSDRLSQPFRAHYDWSAIKDSADQKHQDVWKNLGTSKELFDFAYHGRQLYDAIFPLGKDLRSWLDKAPPGLRINIDWRPTTGAGWVPHVPWGLMFSGEVKAGAPVDPTGFWGLRYRLGYSAYPPGASSKALGKLHDSWCANFLYYGDDLTDTAVTEGKWQKDGWSAWEKQFTVPTGTKSDRRAEIMDELSMPTKVPTSVLYIFCQCKVGSGNMPVLQFGPDGEIRHTELGTSELTGHPLVFANACVTGASDPQIVNELEKSFFQRKCRAYIGTEARVPVSMASRFASVFFHFFYRLIDPTPMPAGEALSQARLFLWSHYKNIGGLFYTQINRYDLYMANDGEISSLRRR